MFCFAEGMLRLYCETLGIDFQESMLNWNPIDPEIYKNEWELSKDWVQVVLKATGFLKKPPSGYPDVKDLPKEVQVCIEENIPRYEQLYAQRIQPKQWNCIQIENFATFTLRIYSIRDLGKMTLENKIRVLEKSFLYKSCKGSIVGRIKSMSK